MSTVDSARGPVFIVVLALVAAMVTAAAQEPTLVRLNDAIGDTIDRAERDSFNLFPTTAEFHDAVILALPGPEFFARIRRADADSTRDIFLRIMPHDLERIRSLIDNHENVAARQRADPTYAQSLASFWQTIEDSPLRNMTGEPEAVEEVRPVTPEAAPVRESAAANRAHPTPPETATADELQARLVAVVVRLHDAIGDTIDRAERDSFSLFPKTAEFHDAVILALPGPEFFARIRRADADSTRDIFLRIMPHDLERIRSLIDNHESVAARQRTDSTYAQSLASFWQTIEDNPLRNMAGEPEVVDEVVPGTPEAAPAVEPSPKPLGALVRLSDAVGDTIDRAERDRFQLFPNTTGFRHAVILALPGPRFLAEVTRFGGNTTEQVYYYILPGQLERIRFLIDDRPYIAPQARSREALALTSFWREIEGRPLRDITGEPAATQQVTLPPTGAAIAGEPIPAPATVENRYTYALHGATCGSIAGNSLWPGTGIGAAASVGLTVAGSTVGYMMGRKYDLQPDVALLPRKEGRLWRTCCAVCACVPGLSLGVAAAALASRGHAGIPAYLAGLCVTVEVVTLGYRLGRSIDRNNAR